MSEEELGYEGLQTRAIHASRPLNSTHAVGSPIWQTTTFRADSGEHFVELAKAVKPAEYYTYYANLTRE